MRKHYDKWRGKKVEMRDFNRGEHRVFNAKTQRCEGAEKMNEILTADDADERGFGTEILTGGHRGSREHKTSFLRSRADKNENEDDDEDD